MRVAFAAEVRRPAPVTVPPRRQREVEPVEPVISPPSTDSPDSPESPDSPDSMGPDSPSRIVVRNTFIDIRDEFASGSDEPGSPHRGNSAPASPTQRADPWDNVDLGEGQDVPFGVQGPFGKAPNAEDLEHLVHFGTAQDGRWLRDLASPKKVSARPRKTKGVAAEAEGTSSMRLGDLLKLGIPGQPVERDDGETELEKQMQQFRVQQDHLLRSQLQPVLEGNLQADVPGTCLSGLGAPPAPAVSSTAGVWPGSGYRGPLPGQPLLPNMEVPLAGCPPMHGAGRAAAVGPQLQRDLDSGCGGFSGQLPGFLQQPNNYVGQDAGSRIPPLQDAGSRVPPQQVLWSQGLDAPYAGGGVDWRGGGGGQNLPFNLASSNFAGGLMAAGGMLLAQGISSLQQQQLQLQQQQEQLERLRQSIDPQMQLQAQAVSHACQASFMPSGCGQVDSQRGNRQPSMKKGGGRAINAGRGGKRMMEDEALMAGRKQMFDQNMAGLMMPMDPQAGGPGAKEKAKVPLSGGGPKRTDYIKKFGGANEQHMEGTPTTQPITTMMLKNIPCRKSQEEVMATIDEEGFGARYDFFYLPRDVKFRANLGYAFINFVTPEDAADFQNKMDGYRFPNSGSAKACIVVPAHVQGALNNLQAFKRTEVMRSNRKPFFSSVVAL
ncbi:ML2 [Symbiodinium natans]|uniref:ML2 protein n=1 Tax=Symbiodinium natans TaxID=878477 RepID=A0A812S1C0_9DINO|nr:ML2 [Symbiodinium natans]